MCLVTGNRFFDKHCFREELESNTSAVWIWTAADVTPLKDARKQQDTVNGKREMMENYRKHLRMIKLYSKLHYSCPQLRSDALNGAAEPARLPAVIVLKHVKFGGKLDWKVKKKPVSQVCKAFSVCAHSWAHQLNADQLLISLITKLKAGL